ncbi:cutinase transcription factor 1 beta [Fusarium beomiforme]|uniref:Cutinase transcription factor 1 beta n=1 Tax=Fusarium beomiforme TaxID=44412 RepID=A0A9P5DUT8_9HYPO|nr:cutinase transcription factor 1 beta [Fusarium beomiforme]
MSDIPADEQQYPRNTIGRRKRRARRACLTCRSRKVRCDVTQKSPCRPRKSPCKKKKQDSQESTQKAKIPNEDAPKPFSYNPHSPPLSHIEVKNEDFEDLEMLQVLAEDVLAPLTPISQLTDDYCFGLEPVGTHLTPNTDDGYHYWPLAESTSLLAAASSTIEKEQDPDPIIWYGGEGIDDGLIGSLLALPFDNLRHI